LEKQLFCKPRDYYIGSRVETNQAVFEVCLGPRVDIRKLDSQTLTQESPSNFVWKENPAGIGTQNVWGKGQGKVHRRSRGPKQTAKVASHMGRLDSTCAAPPNRGNACCCDPAPESVLMPTPTDPVCSGTNWNVKSKGLTPFSHLFHRLEG
jgi:hypothetical protein